MRTSLIWNYVERRFSEMTEGYNDFCLNPITGGSFVMGVDPIEEQKQQAYRALVAQEWFALHGPPDAPSLPIVRGGADAKRGGDVGHLLAYYTQSVHNLDYAVHLHPSFDDYARGVLALSGAPAFFSQNEQLKKRFPPRPLPGLTHIDLIWRPAKEHGKILAVFRRTYKDFTE